MTERPGTIAGAATVTPDDPRYENLLDAYNHRFVTRPEVIRVPTTTEQVVDAVQAAVTAGKRIVVRSGGHCFENFSALPDTQVLLDLSQLDDISYDERFHAVSIGGGAKLGHVYRALFARWGVTVPAGTCFEVGVGGHFSAGGYGHLSRRDGLVVDHLYAVEVVVVDDTGRARAVVATREPDDPHHDLWWAHTGAGGGSFGVVTRYWMRSPDAVSHEPEAVLPKAPARVRRRDVMWSWETMTEAALTTLLRNYCTWYERNSAPDSPYAHMWTNLIVMHRSAPMFVLTAVIDEAVPDSDKLLDAQLEAMSAGSGVQPSMTVDQVMPWMSEWMPSYSWPNDPKGRYKNKAAYLRRGLTDRQLAAVWRHLTRDDYANPSACILLTGFGGRVGAVAPDATAMPQRDSILKLMCSAGMWQDAAEDDVHIGWVREFYRDLFAQTGGVPVCDDRTDGSYIGYPDVDLADPAWNTSGVSWQELYYKGNYPRLQAVKRRYDPGDVFRHGLSVELPA
ncbi:FAD-binding oxidoreductase [Micromonospora sp. R77]|uniref:FAD-binding oxidoreductase n=1 Tax=Micromonospora sp. R77 TaxID=2925836 RepID=UPI001F6136D5|nr:FAD-binding oxidoreductase [Micromonospora sp. R77]MCI4061242.1 FAD-binding oxidoreductase [Micromonospora sp. R77]